MTVLTVEVEKKLGAFQLAVGFEAAGGVTALFGPSGTGKTTIINMIAGLLTPDRGLIALNGSKLFDAADRINVPPHRRHIGYVFQEGRLFPHLSVQQNIDYGRRMSGARSKRIRARCRDARHRPPARPPAAPVVGRRTPARGDRPRLADAAASAAAR